MNESGVNYSWAAFPPLPLLGPDGGAGVDAGSGSDAGSVGDAGAGRRWKWNRRRRRRHSEQRGWRPGTALRHRRMRMRACVDDVARPKHGDRPRPALAAPFKTPLRELPILMASTVLLIE